MNNELFSSQWEITFKWQIFSYVVIIPWGNPTALVIVDSTENITNTDKKKINDLVISQEKNVEQVGFVIDNINKPKLEMAWWEFCGNATRAAIWYYFVKNKIKIKTIQVSWTKKSLETKVYEVLNEFITETEVPIFKEKEKALKKINNDFLVVMEWIMLIVLKDDFSSTDSEEIIKQAAFQYIQKYDFLDEDFKKSLCVWIIYFKEVDSQIEMKPIIFVRSIQTLFYETACWSWTCAIWIVEAYKSNKNIVIDVLQPSWEVLTTSILFDWKEFQKAFIKWKANIW